MITYTTKLDDAYASLFEEIAERGGPKIENLEQFFGNIQEIAQIDEKFLRLPLDEPMLVIDANTRKIDVDSTPFKANGIAVQGDHLAETVFFKIDKYFDYMDLMNTDIYINWKIGSESGRDKCFIKSDSIIPGCIVFGWSIADHMTGKSGALSFAVELEIVQDDGKKYSLNTLSANLAVKDGLVLVNPETYDMKDNVLAILSNSEFTSDGVAAVDPVMWISGGGNGLVKNIGDEFEPVVNLDASFDVASGELSSAPVIMYALATSGRDASILYSDKNKGTQISHYVAAPNAALNDKVAYFVAEESVDAVPAYRRASDDELKAWENDRSVLLYVEVIEIEVADVGEYYVHAQGVKYDNAGNKIGASAVTASTPVIVPPAAEPVAVNISAVEQPEVQGYTFDESAANTIYLTADEAVSIAASAEFVKEDDIGLLAFSWYKDGVAVSEDAPVYSDENESGLSVSLPGEYYVKASHYRNNEIKEKESEKKLVSALASKVSLEPVGRFSIHAGRVDSFSIGYTLEKPEDAYAVPQFICELYSLEEGQNGEIIEANSQIVPINGVSVSVEDKEISCKVAASAIPNDGGLYRVKVSHFYNGSIYSVYTNDFAINIS